MKPFKTTIVSAAILAFVMGLSAQEKAPLKLLHSTPLPQLHDGDFDHLTPDVEGNRLFVTAEENSKVLIFDLKTDKLIHTIDDVKAPHSLLYRADLKKLFVVDSDLGEVKIYETDSYKPAGSIKVREGADASGYDPLSKLFYVVNGGKDAKLPNAYISVIDVTIGKTEGDIKIDSDDVEGVAFEKSGPRMFVNVRGKNAVEVFDRNTRALMSTWSIAQEGKNPTSMAFDENAHRLFLGTRVPGKLVVLDSDSGKAVAGYPAAAMVDDMTYDSGSKRIYFAGTEFLDVFHQQDADHYDRVGHIPTSFRAKTGVLVPDLKRFYLAVPHHEKQVAELRVYEVLP
ncbi:MAG TPA: YncE family protein [Candidatus Sulfotelmatobacter sp.]|nr:YncE family protein [Candidatus Sulfotelmatobacter sp.]